MQTGLEPASSGIQDCGTDRQANVAPIMDISSIINRLLYCILYCIQHTIS